MASKTKTSKTTAPVVKGAKGTNGAGRSWRPGARELFENDGFERGSGKGGTVKVHGITTTGYQRGCRCEDCKSAMSAFNRKRRIEKKALAEEAAKAAAAEDAEGAEEPAGA